MPRQRIKKDEIEQVIGLLQEYAPSDFVFTHAYEKRLALRNIKHDFVLKTFPEFEKVKLVEEEVLPKGDTGFDLYYELSNSKTLIVGVIPLKKLIFTHVILRERRWQGQLKFIKQRR